MNKTLCATTARWIAALLCLTFLLWSLPGCGGSEDSHDDGDGHAHATTGDDGHGHDDGDSHDDGDGHAHDDADADHGHDHNFMAPKTYADAVHMIHEAMESIEASLTSNQLAAVHTKAEVVTQAARLVGQLALAEGSGVSRDAIRDVNVAGRDLANISDVLLEASDAGDLATSKANFERMKAHVETLAMHAGMAGEHSGHDEMGHDH